jgi:hypothetical protein
METLILQVTNVELVNHIKNPGSMLRPAYSYKNAT